MATTSVSWPRKKKTLEFFGAKQIGRNWGTVEFAYDNAETLVSKLVSEGVLGPLDPTVVQEISR